MTAIDHLGRNSSITSKGSQPATNKTMLIALGILTGAVLLGTLVYWKWPASQTVAPPNSTPPNNHPDPLPTDEAGINHLLKTKTLDEIQNAIQKGLNVDKASHMETALLRSDDDIASLVAEKLSDPNVQVNGKPILAVAVEKAFDKTAAALVGNKADADLNMGGSENKPLIYFVIEKKLPKTLALLAKDAKVNEKTYKISPEEISTPLRYALKIKFDEGVAAFINAGLYKTYEDITVHTSIHDSKTPLPLSEKALLDNKINKSNCDKLYCKNENDIDVEALSQEEKDQLLRHASNLKMFTFARTLVESGANQMIKHFGEEEEPLMFLAAIHDDINLFWACLKQKPDLNKTYAWQGEKYTPLQYCVDEQKHDCTSLLVKEGANPDSNVRWYKGAFITESALLFYGIHHSSEEIVQACIEQGANLDRLDNGKSLMEYANEVGADKLIKLLYRKGRDSIRDIMRPGMDDFVLEQKLDELKLDDRPHLLNFLIDRGKTKEAKEQVDVLDASNQSKLLQNKSLSAASLLWVLDVFKQHTLTLPQHVKLLNYRLEQGENEAAKEQINLPNDNHRKQILQHKDISPKVLLWMVSNKNLFSDGDIAIHKLVIGQLERGDYDKVVDAFGSQTPYNTLNDMTFSDEDF